MRRAKRPHPLFNLPFYFTMVNFAAVIAIAKFLSGERQIVWDKAESARLVPVRLPDRAATSGGNGSKLHDAGQPEVESTHQKVAKN